MFVNVVVVLDVVKKLGVVLKEDFFCLVGCISFFVNLGICFIIEICKMCVFVDLWDEIC